MKKSRAVLSDKEQLAQKVMLLAKQSKSLQELAKHLQSNQIKPYYRNQKLTGVWSGNRKYRLTTLGVGKVHLKQLTLEQERLDKLSKMRKGKTRNRGLER